MSGTSRLYPPPPECGLKMAARRRPAIVTRRASGVAGRDGAQLGVAGGAGERGGAVEAVADVAGPVRV